MKRAADPPILQADESTTVPGRRRRLLPVVTATEATLAAAAVALDLLVPTLVLLAMAAVSLSLRREPLGSLGLRRPTRARRMCVQVLGLSLLWTTLTLTLVLPVVEHLSGERQDLGAFADLEGDLALLVVLLAASWTLAAVGEEVAYRGYLLTRLRQLLPAGMAGSVAAVTVASLLFGLAHAEQGLVGVAVTTLDAAYFAVLRYRFATLWASVLAHGLNNTIGLVGFYLVGPVYGLW